jgi:hypothetical protein
LGYSWRWHFIDNLSYQEFHQIRAKSLEELNAKIEDKGQTGIQTSYSSQQFKKLFGAVPDLPTET